MYIFPNKSLLNKFDRKIGPYNKKVINDEEINVDNYIL